MRIRLQLRSFSIFHYFLISLMIGSCSPKNTEPVQSDDTCIHQDGSDTKRGQLENGIRGQVRFLEEQDHLSPLRDKMTEYKIPATSLAIIHQGRIEWAETYQNPDFTGENDLDCSSIFQAASLSKPVTFIAALRMQAAGVLDLDTPVQAYLKEYELPQGQQTEEHPVTLRNIFSHTSGIIAGGYQGYEKSLPMPSDIDILQGGPGVNSPAVEVVGLPDESISYSGGAYTLAEVALQDVFSEEFAGIMREWILDPVGMTNSQFTQPLRSQDSIRTAKGYLSSGEVVSGGWRNYPEQAAAGLWSNSVDLAKFLIEIYKAYHGKSELISQSIIDSILSQEREGQLYGFIVNRSGDDISITHYGGNMGYRTGMTISLTSGNGLVYLINSENGGALGNELLISASQVYDWQHFKQTEVKRKNVSAEILMELPGQYKWNDQVDLSVTYDEDSNQISLYFPNGDEYVMSAIEGDDLEFIHSNTGVRVTFLEENDFQSFILYGQTAVKMN